MLDRLNHLIGGKLSFDEPMNRHTSFRIGGPADALFVPRDTYELKRALKGAQELGIGVTVIGNGSNLLVRDGGIRGLVIKLSGTLDYVHVLGTSLRAGSGVLLSTLAHLAVEAGLAGFEFAAGIPGTLGGALNMNAGAYDGEMKDVVSAVRALTLAGEEVELKGEELDFGYRHSALKARALVAVEATLSLVAGDRETSLARIAELNRLRREKQPIALPSAGSIFKRPPGQFAGRLIEQAGLKGCRIGDAEVSPLHAGFIVNIGNATARDVLDLIFHVQSRVREQSGILLEPEVRVVGEDKREGA
ncbi:MAG: UDP-N-acetylenolpyruvoylglucosamine reductase [Firmicutes bacterium]|nr:UDP-N-acetylenolpyruvoylglucosamine reductase [candidate division NPL-UPA2 bacterium]MBT9156049.1 UDP-N-acetylenolpyruvoylglucosamine reductase [candidate division NPL-UPA2 bacterium]